MWENQQDGKHEFYRGEVYAMVGGLRVHGRIVSNLHYAFRKHLEGKPCQPFAEAMKLQLADAAVFYPDVFVTCDPRDLSTAQVFSHPTVICEVLSPSTEAYDRGLKFAAYRTIASLQEYVLLSPDTREVTLYRRNKDGNFVLLDFTGAGELHFASLDMRVSLADVFDSV